MSDLEHKKNAAFAPLNAVDPCLLQNEPWLDPKAAYRAFCDAGVRPLVWKATPEERAMGFTWFSAFKSGVGGRSGQKPAFSLQRLALLLGKSARTVKRYCEAGLMPSGAAWKTRCGHWRVSKSQTVVRHLRAALTGKTRRREKYRNESDVIDRLTRRTHLAKHLHAATSNQLPEEFPSPDSASCSARERAFELGVPLDELRRLVRAACANAFAVLIPGDDTIRAAGERPKQSALFVAARRLGMLGKGRTASALARELGIARSTFYLRHSKREIREALGLDAAQAGRSAGFEGAELVPVEDLRDEPCDGDGDGEGG